MSKKSRSVSNLVTELQAACDRMTPERRMFLNKFVHDRFPADVLQLIEEMTPIPDDAGEMLTELTLNMRGAVKAGFVLALARYSRELKANKEAMSIVGARADGGDKGRKAQARKKADRAVEIKTLFSQGIEPKDIAREKKCSLATVYRALGPTAEKPSTASRRSRQR